MNGEFDPDAYLSAGSAATTDFDPDAYLGVKKEVQPPSPTPATDTATDVLGKIGTAVKHNIEPFIQHPLEAAYETFVPTMDDIRSIGNLVKAETYKQNLQPGSQEWYDRVLGYSAPLILGAAAKGAGIARGIKPETPGATPEPIAPEPVAPRGPVPIEAQIGTTPKAATQLSAVEREAVNQMREDALTFEEQGRKAEAKQLRDTADSIEGGEKYAQQISETAPLHGDVQYAGRPEEGGGEVPAPVSGEGVPARGQGEVVAGQPRPAPEETVAPQSFTTSLGSTYTVHGDGTTTRIKSPHPETPGDVGEKPQSTNTFYVTPEQATKLGEVQAQGTGTELAQLPDGRWGMRYTEGPSKGKFESRTVTEVSDQPAVGLQPVEVFDQGQPHFGNKITEVTGGTEPPETVSTKNIYTEAQRAARGFPEAEQAARRSFGPVWDEAAAEAQNDPGIGIRLVDELNKKPRNVSDTENAHLLRAEIAAESEHSAAVEAVNNAPTESDRTAAQSRLDIARDNLQDVYDATKRAGTKSGQALASRQMMAHRNYTLGAMEARSRAANKGQPLNEPQLRKVEASFNKITGLQNKLATHEVAQAKALARYKTYLRGQTGKVGAKIAAGDFTKVPRQKTKLDAEAFTMRANLQRLKNEFERGVAKQAYKNKGPAQKFWDHFVGVQRGFKLSGPEIPGKLGVAAATREVLAPIESAGGYVVSRVLPGLAKGTKYGAGLKTVIGSELKAKAALFTRGMKDAADNIRGRETQLEAIGDKAGRGPEFWYNRIGKLHAAIKAPVKRAEFTRSLAQRMDVAARSGEDINHPEVMARLANEAGMDANRAIFQQNTVVSNFFSMLDRQLPAGARVARFLFPVVKIPINLFKELVTYHAGAPAAAVKIGRAYWRGIETLAPLEREAIIRQLVKGSVGGAALLWGYYNSDKVRGFFDAMPNWFGHTPIAMALNEGSYLKQMEAKNPEGAKGLKHMAKADIPFMYTVTDITNALDSHDSSALQKWVYNMTTSTVDPQLLQQVAKGMDKPGTFPLNMGAKPAYRRPQSIAEAVMVGIPGLREQVPVTPLRGAGTSLYKGQRTTKGTRLYH